ncbi:hypothetical protein C2G38_2133235 [Gigaspora rosea]|uniref:histidine--tRNA ligase n=1 Tax=Gigaspora rosea TaxID=44941 RepID=A0A397UEH5_9GLOM|nr:hypothetical protein C2G38_2133235 [Gigaspora rosea]
MSRKNFCLLQITGEDGSAKSRSKFTLKTPKGTRDYNEKEIAIREKVFSTIVSVFKKHEILSEKYGEDSKLIYDLNDQGGEKCSLRYDLTVPFARFLTMNGSQYQNIKRNQIAKVYRRDQPAMTKGRMREFYQCDFDIAGVCDPSDSEINHRKILDGIFQICGVPDASIRPISYKLDKDVKKEMTEEKGLDPNIADHIGEYVKLKGNKELLDKLSLDQSLISNNNTKNRLARGLDYYIGIIYEAVTEQSGPPSKVDNGKKSQDGNQINQIVRKTKIDSDELDETTVGVGSIAAGGRYDNLVGMFASNKKGNILCVGISIVALEQVKANEVEVYVMAFADGLLEDRMKICSELWDAGIKAEFMYKNKPKLQPQFSVYDRDQIPFAVIIGRDELNLELNI